MPSTLWNSQNKKTPKPKTKELKAPKKTPKPKAKELRK